MAQMPIQTMSGRADPYAAMSPAARAALPRVAIPRASYVYDPGGISGGMLRPGSIDQELFKAHLAAAQKEALLAPSPLPKPSSFAGVPNLSPAQLAALGIDVGGAVEAPAEELVLDIPAPNPAEPAQGGAQPQQVLPDQVGGVPGEVPGETDAALAENTPGTAAAQVAAERGPFPSARRGADGVWELTRRPDKDEREMLYGQRWRVVESEASRKLFLGPDGEFGWDDFLDIINPLQHIPFVNLAYRAVTGDEIYGAARMVDFAFGPMAGVSTAVDLAFRDMTGASMAENAVAALFGPSETGTGETGTGETAPGDAAPAGDLASVNTASGDRVQLADAGTIRRGSNK